MLRYIMQASSKPSAGKALILFPILVLLCAGLNSAWAAPAGPEPSDYIVHAMGNVEQLQTIFLGIVWVIDSPAFQTAVALTMAIALVMQGFAGQFATTKLSLSDLIGDKVKTLLVPIALTSIMFAGPRATVWILDPYWGHSSGLVVQIVAPRKVDGVPIGLAMFANFFSVTRTHLQAAFDEKFSDVSDLRYAKTGMLFGNKVMTNLASIQVNNPNLRADLIAYMRNCYFYDVYQGRISPDAVRSPDIWKAMTHGVTENVTGPNRKTWTYGESILANPNRLTQVIYDKQFPRPSSAGPTETNATLGCKDAVAPITAKLQAMSVHQERSWAALLLRGARSGEVTDGGAAAFATSVGGLLPNFMASGGIPSTYSVADHIRQAAMTNLVKESGGDIGSILSNPAIVAQATAQAQSEVAVKSNYIQTARLAEMALPLIRNGLEAVAYGCFPIVILVALAYGTGAIAVLKSYLIGLGTLQIWGPLYSIVNILGTDYSKNKLGSMLAGQPSFTLENIHLISNEMSSDMAVMGYLVLLVPVIAGMLVKAGMDGVSGMASQMLSPATGTAASTMAQNASLGNYSWDNLSQGNTTAHNFTGFTSSFNNTQANKFNPETMISGGSSTVTLQDKAGTSRFSGERVVRKEDLNVGPEELSITTADAASAHKQWEDAKKALASTTMTKNEAYTQTEKSQKEYISSVAKGIKQAVNTYGDNWVDHVSFVDQEGKTQTLGSLEYFKSKENRDSVKQAILNANKEDGSTLNSSPTAKADINHRRNLAIFDAVMKSNAVTAVGTGLFAKGATTTLGTARWAAVGAAGSSWAGHDLDIYKSYAVGISFSGESSHDTKSGGNAKWQESGQRSTAGGTKNSSSDRTGKRDEFSDINEEINTKREQYTSSIEHLESASLNEAKAISAEKAAKETDSYLHSVTASGTYKPMNNPQETADLAISNAYAATHPGTNGATMQDKRDWLNANEGGVAQTAYAKALTNYQGLSSQEKIKEMRGFLLGEKQNGELKEIQATDNDLAKKIKAANYEDGAAGIKKDFKDNPLVQNAENSLNSSKKKVISQVDAATDMASKELRISKQVAEQRQLYLASESSAIEGAANNQLILGENRARNIPGTAKLGSDWSTTGKLVDQYVNPSVNPEKITGNGTTGSLVQVGKADEKNIHAAAEEQKKVDDEKRYRNRQESLRADWTTELAWVMDEAGGHHVEVKRKKTADEISAHLKQADIEKAIHDGKPIPQEPVASPNQPQVNVQPNVQTQPLAQPNFPTTSEPDASGAPVPKVETSSDPADQRKNTSEVANQSPPSIPPVRQFVRVPEAVAPPPQSPTLEQVNHALNRKPPELAKNKSKPGKNG